MYVHVRVCMLTTPLEPRKCVLIKRGVFAYIVFQLEADLYTKCTIGTSETVLISEVYM